MKNIIIGIAIGILAYRANASKIGALKAYKFIPVYNEIPGNGKNGTSNIAFASKKRGVYIIKENDLIVYVGSSTIDLYKTSIRHFQEWDSRQRRVTYKSKLKKNRYTIRFIFMDSDSRIRLLESALIQKYNPRDNMRQEESTFVFSLPKANIILNEYNNAEYEPAPF